MNNLRFTLGEKLKKALAEQELVKSCRKCGGDHGQKPCPKKRYVVGVILLVLAVISACGGCIPGAWDDVPTASVRVEAPPEYLDAWRVKVQFAVDSWSAVLPTGCPAPFQLADEGHPIRLIPNAQWRWGHDVLGIQDDGGIEVRLEQGNVKATVAHELGHALGLDHATPDRARPSIMTYSSKDPGSADLPTMRDGMTAAHILECGL